MSKIRLVTVLTIVSIIAIVAINGPLAPAKAQAGCGQAKAQTGCGQAKKQAGCGQAKKQAGCAQVCKIEPKKACATNPESATLDKGHSAHLPMVSQSIDKAIKAIEAGDNKAALKELNKAKKMLAAIKKGLSKHAKPKFANTSCPIMGLPINPDKVAKNLIRDYKDKKIAFCCGGCPGRWDKLSDTEKDAKLAKAKPSPKPMKNHSKRGH